MINVGQCKSDPVTGACGRVFNALQSKGAATLGFAATAFTDDEPARNALAALIECIVSGVVEELKANAVVRTPVSAGGLQRYDKGGGALTDTDPPSATMWLEGGIE